MANSMVIWQQRCGPSCIEMSACGTSFNTRFLRVIGRKGDKDEFNKALTGFSAQGSLQLGFGASGLGYRAYKVPRTTHDLEYIRASQNHDFLIKVSRTGICMMQQDPSPI